MATKTPARPRTAASPRSRTAASRKVAVDLVHPVARRPRPRDPPPGVSRRPAGRRRPSGRVAAARARSPGCSAPSAGRCSVCGCSLAHGVGATVRSLGGGARDLDPAHRRDGARPGLRSPRLSSSRSGPGPTPQARSGTASRSVLRTLIGSGVMVLPVALVVAARVRLLRRRRPDAPRAAWSFGWIAVGGRLPRHPRSGTRRPGRRRGATQRRRVARRPRRLAARDGAHGVPRGAGARARRGVRPARRDRYAAARRARPAAVARPPARAEDGPELAEGDLATEPIKRGRAARKQAIKTDADAPFAASPVLAEDAPDAPQVITLPDAVAGRRCAASRQAAARWATAPTSCRRCPCCARARRRRHAARPTTSSSSRSPRSSTSSRWTPRSPASPAARP